MSSPSAEIREGEYIVGPIFEIFRSVAFRGAYRTWSDLLFLAIALCENPAMPVDRRRAKIFFIGLLVLIALVIGYAISENLPWRVPEEAKQRSNPIQPSPATLGAAKSIYSDKCANCHGDSGKGDGADANSYYPKPSDLADPSRMNNVTDGELFYKISEGHKPMPAFKRKLTEEQRWQLVLLVRSFSQFNVTPGVSSGVRPAR